MSKVGRNEPCSCGSGRKAKRCCGVERGPTEESLARAFLARASQAAASELRRLSDRELLDLFEEVWELPCTDLSLQVALPKLLTPVLDRLCEAIADDDPDPDLVEAAARSIDGPLERARLARAAVAQAEAGRIDRELAAAALLDLGSDSATSCKPPCSLPSPCGSAGRHSGRDPARRVGLKRRGKGARSRAPRPARSLAPGRPG